MCLLASYADTTGKTIVNQVENVYPGAAAQSRCVGTGFRGVEAENSLGHFVAPLKNGLGQLTQQYQAVTGAVDTSSTPSVQYTYSDPSNGSLLTSMVYPNGRTIDYSYGSGMANSNAALLRQEPKSRYTGGSVPREINAIGRLDGIVDGTNSGDAGQVLEQYSYLG